MPGKRVPVYRDDGRAYASGVDAARDLAADWGYQVDKRTLYGMASTILASARGRRGVKSAYGHRWMLEDVYAKRQTALSLKARVKELEDALGAANARLENANEILRANGLEMQ